MAFFLSTLLYFALSIFFRTKGSIWCSNFNTSLHRSSNNYNHAKTWDFFYSNNYNHTKTWYFFCCNNYKSAKTRNFFCCSNYNSEKTWDFFCSNNYNSEKTWDFFCSNNSKNFKLVLFLYKVYFKVCKKLNITSSQPKH